MPTKIAVVLPHQDDEVFLFPFLRQQKNKADDIHLLFLTTGESKKTTAQTRNEESRRALLSTFGSSLKIQFLGSELNFKTRLLHENFEQAYIALKNYVTKNAITTLVFPAREGGHIDHDSTNFICLTIAQELDIKAYYYYLYNGETTPLKLFRVLHPLNIPGITKIRYHFDYKDLPHLLRMIAHYRSQKSTWLMLSLDFFTKLLVTQRGIFLVHANFTPVLRKKPLYQRMNRGTEQTWKKAAALFLASN